MSVDPNETFWDKWSKTFGEITGVLILSVRLPNGTIVVPYLTDIINTNIIKSALSGFHTLFNLLTTHHLPAREQRWAFRKIIVHAIKLPNQTVLMTLHIRNEQQFDHTQYNIALDHLKADLQT